MEYIEYLAKFSGIIYERSPKTPISVYTAFLFLFQKFMCDLKGPVAQMNVRVNDILVSGKLDYATGKS